MTQLGRLANLQRHPDVESGSVHVLAIHAAARLPLRWASEITPWSRRLPSPRHAEWQEAVKVLREEPGAAVWFLGETSRRGELRFRDLALIDPRGQQPVRHFSWPFDTTGLLDGIRPALVDLYEVRAPGWIATDGWALTPETAGVAKRDHRGPAYGPIEALVRRREGDGVLLLGGRHLGTAADGPGRVEVAVDGRTIADFPVSVTPKFFLRLVPLPAGSLAGDGVFARLAVRVLAPDGTPRAIPIAIEQFDVDSADGLVYGYDAGWQEAEYDPGRQIQWRWMSERATILVHAGVGGPLTLSLTAESPRKYFDRAPAITVRVGDTRLAHLVPDARVPRLLARATGGSTFSLSVPIDREALARASNRVTLEADQYFTPAARDENADQRHLSMRVLELSVTRAAR